MEDLHRQRVEHLCQELESGRFNQGQNVLRQNDRYCCLGVACALVDEGRWQQRSAISGTYRFVEPGVDLSEYGYGRRFSIDDVPSCTVYLPDDVQAYYGFETQDPRARATCVCIAAHAAKVGDPSCESCGGHGVVTHRLSALNDQYHWDFKQIARAIRETFLMEVTV